MEGILSTKNKDFYTDEITVVHIALTRLWNIGLKETLYDKNINKFTRKEMIKILDYLKQHPELFYSLVTYQRFIDNLEQLVMLMHGNEKCSITYHV